MPPSLSQTLLSGRYQLEHAMILEGGRQVWRARDLLLHRPVVVKGVCGTAGTERVAEVGEEFQRLRLLAHPRIARAYDFGHGRLPLAANQTTPFTYFTQEWIAGPSLRNLRGTLPPAEVLAAVTALLEVVAFLHQQRLVCLDLKAAHVLRSELGWRLIDLDQALTDDPLREAALRGTLSYLAPEVLAGQAATARSDLYSLGMVALEALTGSLPPVTAGEAGASLPALPSRLDLEEAQAPALVALIRALLQADPVHRPESAEEALCLLGQRRGQWRAQVNLPEGVFVGQEGVLASLEAAMADADRLSGGGFVVLGGGEQGRSRLLAECTARWQAAGAPALWVKGEGAARGGVLELLQEHLRQVAGTSPELTGQGMVRQPGGGGQEPASLQLGWLSRLVSLGRGAAARAGRLVPLLIDDVDTLDELTRGVLQQLATVLPGSGLWLGVVDGAADASRRWPGLTPVTPVPLEAPALRSLSEAILGPGALSVLEVEELRRVSGGLAGPARDLLALVWTGQPLSAEEGGQAGETRRLAMLAGLSAEALEVARWGAVLEEAFDGRLLGEVADRNPIGPQLAELLERGVLVPAGAGPGLFAYPRASLQRRLFRQLSGEAQGLAHQRAALALERRAIFEPGHSSPLSVARHFMAGGLSERALPYLGLARRLAQQTQSLGERAQCLQLSLELPGPVDQVQALRRELGDVYLAQRRWWEARAQFEQLLSDPAGLGPALRVFSLAGLGKALVYQGALPTARGLLEEAVRPPLVWEVPRQELAAWRHLLAYVYAELSEFALASQTLAQVREEGVLSGSRLEVDQLYMEAHVALKWQKDGVPVEEWLSRAAEVARGLGASRDELKVLNLLAQAQRMRGALAEAVETLEALAAMAQASFEPVQEALAEHNLGMVQRQRGEFRSALGHYERAEGLQRRLGNTLREMENRLAVVELLLDCGLVDRAEEGLARVRRYEQEHGGLQNLAALQRTLLENRLRLSRGELDGLEAALKRNQAELSQAGYPQMAQEVMVDQMVLAQAEGRSWEVLRLCGVLVQEASSRGDHWFWPRVHRLGMEAHARLQGGREAGGGQPQAGAGEARGGEVQAAGGVAVPSEPGGRTLAGAEGRLGEGSRGGTAGPGEALAWLARVGKLLEQADDEAAVAGELAGMAGAILGGRGLVFLYDGHQPEVVRGYRMQADQVEEASNTIVTQVCFGKKPFIRSDVYEDPEVRELRSVRACLARSMVCLPVLRDKACLGAVYVDHRLPGGVGSEESVEVVRRVAELAGGWLEGLGRRRKRQTGDVGSFGLVGESPSMQKLREQLQQLTLSKDSDLHVLLLGETGTGKSMIARAIHNHGLRASGPFVEVNTAAITATLFEGLMFGHEKGAFTGATGVGLGWLENADHGVLFLDEIGDMPIEQQVKLLVVLENHHFSRLGSSKSLTLNAQIVFATNRDIDQEVRAGRLREDFRRRIEINRCRIPSLRERGPEDIALLSRHMITRYLIGAGLLEPKAPLVPLRDFVSHQAEEQLYRYHWPANVGELNNLFRNEQVRQKLRTLGAEKVTLDLVQEMLWQSAGASSAQGRGPGAVASESMRFEGLKEQAERWIADAVVRAYEARGANVVRTSEALKCSRDIVYRYLRLAGMKVKKDAEG